MAKCYSKDSINNLIGKTVFFDTNILIYLFWPTGDSDWGRNYTTLFAKLLKQKNKMAADFIVISEFINRAMRIEFENWKYTSDQAHSSSKFKEFRDSLDGQNTLSDIYQVVNAGILDKFDISGKNYTKANIEEFLIVDNLDFSDKAIATICKENGFILLTNDYDFAKTDLELLTLNSRILNSTRKY